MVREIQTIWLPMNLTSLQNKKFTFIVVGGGTAGCVLAARLSEDPKASVLLVERGPTVDGWAARVPLISSNFTGQKAPVYRYKSAPLPAVNGRSLSMVTGKALGGTSKINGLIYTRSVPAEYDGWEGEGKKGWGWKDVQPFFNKSETVSNGTAEERGNKGA